MASSTMRVVPTVAVLGLRSVRVGEKGLRRSSALSEEAPAVRGKTCRRFSSVAVLGGTVVGCVEWKAVEDDRGPLDSGVVQDVPLLLLLVLLLLLPFEGLFSEASVVF